VVDNSEEGELQRLDLDNAEVLRVGGNIGFAAGNNLGFATAKTDFVALINPDAFAEPDWLDKLIDAAQRYPDCAVFGGLQLFDEDPKILDGLGDQYHPSGIFRREGHARRRDEYGELQPREIFSPCAAAALYRRDALEAARSFPNLVRL
jgi:GT2 family glycosyltransferase